MNDEDKEEAEVIGLRQRKQRNKKSQPKSKKMVGPGNQKFISKQLADISMELELISDDESDNDTTRLINDSMIPKVAINGKKPVSQPPKPIDEDESVCSISVQMFIPFLLAGFGMVAASLLLDVVQVREIKNIF